MRLAERLRGHASEPALLAIIAGGGRETTSAHVSACPACRARLEDLRAWVDGTAADAAGLADEVFTPERLAAQKQQVLERLEAMGRSARVIAFPLGAPTLPRSRQTEIIRWAAAAAVGGIIVGLAWGRLLDPHAASPTVGRTAHAPASADEDVTRLTGLDEAELLEAAYDRVSLGALQTIDDITPPARELARAALPRSGR